MTRIFHLFFLCLRWIPCQALTSVLCLHYRPETVHCSTKDVYTSEITFLALHPWYILYIYMYIYIYRSQILKGININYIWPHLSSSVHRFHLQLSNLSFLPLHLLYPPPPRKTITPSFNTPTPRQTPLSFKNLESRLWVYLWHQSSICFNNYDS